MSTIDINQVQSKIAEMLEAVERGETLEITRQGKAIAVLEPASGVSQPQLPSMAEFRAGLKIDLDSTSNSVLDMRDQERF
jgi:prevent-host-death family protein